MFNLQNKSLIFIRMLSMHLIAISSLLTIAYTNPYSLFTLEINIQNIRNY